MVPVLAGLSQAAAAVREMNWARLYQVLDVIIRYFVPCEAVTLYVVEERGKYLRKVNTHLDTFTPERRGHMLDAVSETTLEGYAAVNAEPCRLPSQMKYSADWATREACAVSPLADPPTVDDLIAGRCPWPPAHWAASPRGEESGDGGPVVRKVHNVLAFPIKFGSPTDDPEDPFVDYASSDSNHVGADDMVFGVLKLTNRLADRPRGKKLQMQRLHKNHILKDDPRYKPFGNTDLAFFDSLVALLREIYFAVDPVTFGSRVERSLDLKPEDTEPLNAPSIFGRSAMSRSVQSGSRMLEHSKNPAAGMFGILGNAFRKTISQRRRAPELPDVVLRPQLAVTSDSTESMRNAPGWVHKEWTEDDLENISAEQSAAGQRRIGGITLLATWRLREDVVLDPFCVICRFQLRVKRVSRVRIGQEALWRELPPFFCIQPDEVTQQYCAFLTDHLHYGEDYVASVRAGTADRWSEWSPLSEAVKFEASALRPRDFRVPLQCSVVAPEQRRPDDPFATKDHILEFSWPAFSSFDPRTPLPVEYCIEAWQREDALGAAAAEQLQAYSRAMERSQAARGPAMTPAIPGAGHDWSSARVRIVATTSTDAVEGQRVECSVDVRSTCLTPGASVYFSVRARYLSLPGTSDWCSDALFTVGPVQVPVVVPSLPTPVPMCGASFQVPDAVSGIQIGELADLGGALVLRWPFMHPATFCLMSATGGWKSGPYIPNTTPDDFPLPYRVQCRAIGPCRGTDPPAWSEWREVEAYQFVRRQVPERQSSQIVAGQRASRGEFMKAGSLPVSSDIDEVADAKEHQEPECLDPADDALGLLRESWALHVSGLDLSEKDGSFWPGLVQVRFVSTSVEGVVSAASRVLCTRVDGALGPPAVDHLVVNCSTGAVSGQGALEAEDVDEDVVHELRHVARLAWQMDFRAPSFPFVRSISIRYREASPGRLLEECPWVQLPATSFTDVEDRTPSGASTTASFALEVAAVPLLRYHRYAFSIQVSTPEHCSDWSSPSAPLTLMLPEVLPLQLAVHGPAGQRKVFTDRGLRDAHQAHGGDEPEPEELEQALPHEADLLQAVVCCSDHEDAFSWTINLQWHAFPLADNGLAKYPTLGTLPVEYQVSYYLLSDRPAATQAKVGGGEAKGFLEHREDTVTFQGYHCPVESPEFAKQRQAATVCLEGWAQPKEFVVERSIPRSRLPPLRCDVRLFVVCRCPVVTGPQWSKSALAVDVVLPRQAQLPLPVPRQLACLEMQARGLAVDLGMPGLDGCLPDGFPADGLWAILSVPTVPTEFVITGDVDVSGKCLLALTDDATKANPTAHYVLQYRPHDENAPRCGASVRPVEEEPEWRTVPKVRQLMAASEESVYLVTGLQPPAGEDAAAPPGRAIWVTFRLASLRFSHFGYASPVACVTVLSPPSKPKLRIDWFDTPSLDGVRIRVGARAHYLTQLYQLRYRRCDADPSEESSWHTDGLSALQQGALGDGNTDFDLDICALVRELEYHGEYRFSIRTASNVRFSPWSEESEPLRLSLEHRGMLPLQTKDGEDGKLRVQFLGLEEQHNYRCPMVDVSWPPLALPADIWGEDIMSPEPHLTIEYRLRWRRRVETHNQRAALAAAVDELCTIARPPGLVIMEPDPDSGVIDVVNRGYSGDCTKYADGTQTFTPWQTAAVVPALSSGQNATERCACALTFLQDSCVYEVAVDWRWRRIGDAFWMPAYGPERFSTLSPLPPPPPPRPLAVAPEVWDACGDLNALGQAAFLMLQWPFKQQPMSAVLPAPPDRQLIQDDSHDPLTHGAYAVQCRPVGTRMNWATCSSRFLLINGKPLCLVSQFPGDGEVDPQDIRRPWPAPTPVLPADQIAEDEVELRLVRSGDCEVSSSLCCTVLPPPPPEGVTCRLKMLPPHSTLVLSVCFQGAPAAGSASVPRRYQLRLEEVGGEARLLPPVELPLERVPEAFAAARGDAAFLGAASPPVHRGELGPDFAASRGGGEAPRVLAPLEFEHLLSFRELRYAGTYRISVRWLTEWRPSTWSPPVEAAVEVRPPRAPEAATLAVRPLGPVELPEAEEEEAVAAAAEEEAAEAAAGEGAGGAGGAATAAAGAPAAFLPPVVADRAEVCWPPFSAPLWGGGRMEYELQRRSRLQAGRPLAGAAGGGLGDDTTPWGVVGLAVTEVEDATGRGVGPASGAEGGEVSLVCEDLMLAAEYQFRVRARLQFHPASGHPGEWSEWVVSDWHRTAPAGPVPSPPFEAAVSDPPPEVLLQDGTALVSFGHLPIREAERPAGCPPPPAPYQLQFRGVNEAPDAAWHRIQCTQLDDERFLLADERLLEHVPEGVTLRLWRCPWTNAGDGVQHPEDDMKVRRFWSLASEPSRPVTVACPRVLSSPTATLMFGQARPILNEDPSCEVEAAPVVLRLGWIVDTLRSASLAPVQLHQVRYRLVTGMPEGVEIQATQGPHAWRLFEPFEKVTSSSAPDVLHELPIAGPHFLFGADYEVAVRVGTRLRWGAWSGSVRFSLAIPAPLTPVPSGLLAEKVILEDGTVFFRLRWNAFRPHHLSAMLEYRIRMMRVTRYKYEHRLSDDMAARSNVSIEAQEKWHVIGCIRQRVPRQTGVPCDPEESPALEELEFLHDVPGEPECGYRFAVDAKHERCDELHPPEEGEVWSVALETEELITPPPAKNWFIPEQVPLEPSPPFLNLQDTLRAPFPLVLRETACERLGLSDARKPALLIFAPWRSSAEPSRWPHRIEYTPYIPQANPYRLPAGSDVHESDVDWHLPASVEYLSEDVDQGETAGSANQTTMVIVRGFDDELWPQAMRRLGIHMQRAQAFGQYVRLRVVREGGPERVQLFSSPSRPMLLRVPGLEEPPSVAVWSVAGRLSAAIWWPWVAAQAGEQDKNLDTSTQAHQIRMRRPLYELDAGWVEGPVRRTPAPALLSTAGASSGQALHAFDCVQLFDDMILPGTLLGGPLPQEPTGPMRDEVVLMFQFSVRVSDGYRWSDWSAPSELCNFALEPKIMEDAPVTTDEVAELLRPTPDTICPAEAPEGSGRSDRLSSALTFREDGDMDPPTWVSISKAAEPQHGNAVALGVADAAANARITQYVVTWPNLPLLAYCQPNKSQAHVFEELLEAGLLPPYVPPPVLYRLNVWLVGSAADAAPMTDLPAGVPPPPELESNGGAVLYRQYDLPLACAPRPMRPDERGEWDEAVCPRTLSWTLPYLMPDRVFRCTVEARFQTLTSVEWWTPLMRSNDFTVDRVAPPPPPEPLPICQLPTPEHQKLLMQTALGSSSLVAVRWPWNIEGRAAEEVLKSATYTLELCASSTRPSLVDPTAKPMATAGEIVTARPQGPWVEAQAVQLYFANFESGMVLHEWPLQAQYEPNWVPVLVASGFPLEKVPDKEVGGLNPESANELTFVHTRWRYRATPADLAVMPPILHFSAASGPIRARVANPAGPPRWLLSCPSRENRVVPWICWTAWAGTGYHQFSYRLLKVVKKKNKRVAMVASKSRLSGASEMLESEAASDRGASPMPAPADIGSEDESPYEAATGWIELAPVSGDIDRNVLELEDPEGDADSPTAATGVRPPPPEDKLLAEFTRRLPSHEWNRILFRHYRDLQEEYWRREGRGHAFDSQSTRSSKPDMSRTSTVTTNRDDFSPTRASLASPRSRRAEMAPWRMTWGMAVEWRVRVSDGLRWSQWSPPSAPSGLVPPIPEFTTPAMASFSGRDPTNMKVTWGMCKLAPEHEQLVPSIEYMVYLTSEESTAKSILQAGQGTFDPEKLRKRGLQMSEGSCGVVQHYPGADSDQGLLDPVTQVEGPTFNMDDLFTEGSELRLVGKVRQGDARLVSFGAEGASKAIQGFELIVSGLRPETVHRVSIRVRCATAGLDELDWQKMKPPAKHPLRWSDPTHTAPLLTPKAPPPVLVPVPVPLPEGKLGRFTPMPGLLVRCSMLKKAHPDDADRDQPLVLDVEIARAGKKEIRPIWRTKLADAARLLADAAVPFGEGNLTWSPWTEFSAPLAIDVPSPRPSPPVREHTAHPRRQSRCDSTRAQPRPCVALAPPSPRVCPNA